ESSSCRLLGGWHSIRRSRSRFALRRLTLARRGVRKERADGGHPIADKAAGDHDPSQTVTCAQAPGRQGVSAPAPDRGGLVLVQQCAIGKRVKIEHRRRRHAAKTVAVALVCGGHGTPPAWCGRTPINPSLPRNDLWRVAPETWRDV